jgi:hypothetical protein
MRWSVLLIALLTSGCFGSYTYERDAAIKANSVFPANYRSEIVALMRTYLNDPSGVRDASVSEPAQRTMDGIPRYFSCVRYNAKKSGGQYAGPRDSMVLFRSGRLDRIVDNETARGQCKDAAYVPFPELQSMTR